MNRIAAVVTILSFLSAEGIQDVTPARRTSNGNITIRVQGLGPRADQTKTSFRCITGFRWAGPAQRPKPFAGCATLRNKKGA